MSSKLLLLLLLGVTVATVDAGRRRQQIQRDVLPEEDCEEDDGDEVVMKPSNGPRIGSSNPRRKIVQQDEGDGVEDPTDEDYLRYEDTNQEGICILERGKCPQGDWRMFKRRNESVCLQPFGSPSPIDAVTAERICRQHANSRLMSLDNQEEREWLWTTALAKNGTFPYMMIAGRRNRNCHVNPGQCQDKMKFFPPMDGSANHEFLHSKWVGGGLGNALIGGEFDSCLAIHTVYAVNDLNNIIRDHTCTGYVHTFLCGITVM